MARFAPLDRPSLNGHGPVRTAPASAVPGETSKEIAFTVTRWFRAWLTRFVSRPDGSRGLGRRHALLWLEPMEDRTVPTSLDISGGVLTYSVTAGAPSDLTISVDSSDTADVIFTDPDQTITIFPGAGLEGFSYFSATHQAIGPADAFTSIDVTGATVQGQTVTVDYTNGDPLAASGLSFVPTVATSGSNSLTLQGGAFLSETDAPTGAGAGTIVYSDVANTNVPITYSNLSADVIDTVTSPTLIFNAIAGATAVNVVNGPIVSSTQTDQINAGGTGDFTPIDFANKAAVTVNDNNAGSTVDVDNSTAAAALSALFVNAGAGTETVDVQGTGLGVTSTIDTGSPSGSTINVTGADGIDGALDLQSTGGSNSVNIGSSAPATGGTLAGIDAAITVGDGISTLVIDDSGDTTAGETATIGASGAGLILTGLDMGGSGSVAAGVGTNIAINAGNNSTSDVFDVDESSAITAPFSLNGGGSGVLNISGGSFTTDTYNFTGPQGGNIHLDDNVITYAGLTSLGNSGTAANEIFNLPTGGNHATLANATAGQLNLDSSSTTFASTTFSNPTNSLTINAGGTADTLAISGPSNLTAGLTAGSSATPFATATLSGTFTLNTGTAALAVTANSISDSDGTSVVQAGTVDLTDTVTADSVGITISGAVVESTTGDVLLQGSGGIDVGAEGSVTASGANAVTLSTTGDIDINGNVSGGRITLRGADIDIGTSGHVGTAATTTNVTIASSVESRPMSIGGTNNAAVAGINLTRAELARIVTTSTGTVTFGDSAQTGDITFSGATTATTAGAATDVVQASAGAGRIIFNTGNGIALDGNGGRVTLIPGTGQLSGTLSATNALIATNGFTATGLTLNLTLPFAPAQGATITLIQDTGAAITGSFANIAPGASVALTFGGTSYALTSSYVGGTGHDFVLNAPNPSVATTPVSRVAFGSVSGGLVSVFDNGVPTILNAAPYAGFQGGIAVAVGDVTGSGVPDLAVVVASGGPALVTVYNGATFAPVVSFFAFPVGYTGGATIALADLYGTGHDDIIVGQRTGGSAVAVYDGLTGALVTAFFAYPEAPVGVTVAAGGDLDGSGTAQIVTTPLAPVPLVRVFNGEGALVRQFLAYDPALGTEGLSVAVGDLTGDGVDQILVGATVGGSNFAEVFSGTGQLQAVLALPPGAAPAAGQLFGPQLAVAGLGGGSADLVFTTGAIGGAFDGSTLDPLFDTILGPGFHSGAYLG